MTLTKERQKEKKARDLIFKALQEYHDFDPGIPEFTEERINAGEYQTELTRKGIDAGVCALNLINNMSAGSVGDIDLYRLLHRYLLDPNSRTQINKIINKP